MPSCGAGKHRHVVRGQPSSSLFWPLCNCAAAAACQDALLPEPVRPATAAAGAAAGKSVELRCACKRGFLAGPAGHLAVTLLAASAGVCTCWVLSCRATHTCSPACVCHKACSETPPCGCKQPAGRADGAAAAPPGAHGAAPAAAARRRHGPTAAAATEERPGRARCELSSSLHPQHSHQPLSQMLSQLLRSLIPCPCGAQDCHSASRGSREEGRPSGYVSPARFSPPAPANVQIRPQGAPLHAPFGTLPYAWLTLSLVCLVHAGMILPGMEAYVE